MLQSGDELDGYNHDRITICMQVGKLQKAMRNKLESIENIMRVSGWFDKSPDGPPDYESLEHIKPSNHVGPGEWETWISEKKDKALQERMSGYGVDGPQGSSRTLQSNTNVVNDVKIVNKCQVREIYGGNSGNSGRQVRTYEMSEGTSASAYVLRPFQTLVPRFRNGEIGDRRSNDRSNDRS